MTILDILIEGKDKASDVLRGVDGALGGLGNTAGAVAKAGLAVAGVAVATVGAAAVAAGKAAVNLSTDIQNATNNIATGLGISQDEAEGFEGVMKGVFANNFGESFDDIGVAIAEITRQMGEMPDDALQGVTEDAFALRDAFELDVGESAQAAAVLMEEMGLSGEQAMDFIAAGMQKGLNNSDDFLDSITEYGGLFGDAGFSADEFFSIMESGGEAGVLGTDKIADSIKEMGIILNEGGEEVSEVFAQMGMDFDLISQFVAGGDEAWSDYFPRIVSGLEDIEDPLERSQAQVALFGTMAEDLGVSFTEGLSTATTSLEDMSGATESLNAQYDNWPSMWAGIKRGFLLALEPLGDLLLDIGNRLMPIVQNAFEKIKTDVIPILEIWFERIAMIFESVDEGMTPLKAITGFLKDYFGPEFASAFGIAVNVVGTLADVLTTVLGVAFDNMKLIVSAFTALFKGDFETFGRDIGQSFTNSLNALVNILGQLWAWVKPVLIKFGNDFVAWFAAQDWKQIGIDTINLVLDGLATLVENAIPIISDWITSLTEWVDDVDWVQVGINIVTSIIAAIRYFEEEVIPTLESWGTAFVNWFAEYNWGALAESIVNGITTKLADLKNSLITAVRDLAEGAWQAFADEIGWGSPAKEWYPLGESMMGGLIVGVVGMIGQLVDAFAEVADAVEVEAAQKMSAAVMAVANSIAPALSAIVAIANFEGPLDIHHIMAQFKDAIFFLTWGVAAAGARLQSISGNWGITDSKRMAESVIVVTEALRVTMDTINQIADYQVVNITHQVLGLVDQIELITVSIVQMSGRLSIDGLLHAQMFSEALISITGIVKPALDAIKQLAQYVEVEGFDSLTLTFAEQLVSMVSALAVAFWEMKGEIQEAVISAAGLSESIQGVVDLVTPGLLAISQLSEFVATEDFVQIVAAFVTHLISMVEGIATGFDNINIDVVEAVDNVAEFSENIGQVLGLITPGLDAILALRDMPQLGDISPAVSQFVSALQTVVVQLAVGLGSLSDFVKDAILDAAELSDAFNQLVSMVQPGIDAVISLGNLPQTHNLPSAIMNFLSALQTVVVQLAIGINTLSDYVKDTILDAAELAGNINQIAGMVQPGIDAIIALGELPETHDLPSAVIRFLSALQTVVVQLSIGINTLSDYVKDAILDAAELAGSINQVVGVIQPGIDAIASLGEFVPPETAAAVTEFAENLISIVTQLAYAFAGAGSVIGAALADAIEFATGANQLVTETMGILDQIETLFIRLQELATTDIPGGISSIMSDVISTMQDAIEPAYQAGFDFGESWISGLREALAGIGAEFGVGGGGNTGSVGFAGAAGDGGGGGLTTNITLGGVNVTIEGGSTNQETAGNLRDVIIETIQDLVTG